MSPPRILLVDDEEDFVELLAKRLRRRQLEVAVAGTGEQALARLAERPVDLVVLDIRLPGMDGLETLRRLKQAHPQTQVIMLTGFADTAMAERATALGAVAYLVKPVDVGELLDRIARAIPPSPTAPPTPRDPR